MPERAEGSFTVELKPLLGDEEWGTFSRLALDKSFHGDLTGSSKGIMLGAQTKVEGSAGYVALERVSGEVAGRTGSFVLQHSGIMSGGDLQLIIQVVPGSGSGDLEAISGTMVIRVDAGEHFYEFEYSLPNSG